MNKIHWKSTARQNRIMVRNNDFHLPEPDGHPQHADPGHRVGKGGLPQLAENAIRVCASVFDQALGQPVRLATNSFTAQERQTIYTSEASSNEHTLELLRTLARLELRSTEDISIYLQNIYDQTVSSDILLVSAYLSEPILGSRGKKMEEGFHVRILVVGFVAAADLPGEEVDVVCLYDYFTRLAKGDQAARERRTAENAGRPAGLKSRWSALPDRCGAHTPQTGTPGADGFFTQPERRRQMMQQGSRCGRGRRRRRVRRPRRIRSSWEPCSKAFSVLGLLSGLIPSYIPSM